MFRKFFQKLKTAKDEKKGEQSVQHNMPGMPDMDKMNFVQRMAMRKFLRMSPAEQQKFAQKMMTPKNIEKHKKELLEGLDQMRAAGKISDDQYRLAKKKMHLE